MTCCSALKNLIAAWLNPLPIGLRSRPPSDFIWPRKDGVMRCSLCGAEWGPVKATVIPLHRTDVVNPDGSVTVELRMKPAEERPRYE